MSILSTKFTAITLVVRLTTSVAACLAFGVGEAGAISVILADTTGEDNFGEPDFYGVNFSSGSGSIQSITYNLRAGADNDALFDFSSSRTGYGPVVDTNSLNGISASNITFSPNSGTTPTLTVSFAPSSFGVGDSFRFGADTDFLASASLESGGSFGAQAVSFIVTLEDGSFGSTTFSPLNDTQSVATVSTQAVPFEFSPGLGLLALGAYFVGSTLRQKLKNQKMFVFSNK